jgi:hypothetical protein
MTKHGVERAKCTFEELIVARLLDIWPEAHFELLQPKARILKHLFEVLGGKVGAEIEHDAGKMR